MQKTANARFKITVWDEKPYREGPDIPKLTRGSVTKTLTGDLRGLRGEGKTAVGHGMEFPFSLNYELD